MGSTDITVDQGGSGGSDALQSDGCPMRRVAAEARRVLARHGGRALRRAGRRAQRPRRRRLGDGRAHAAGHLRPAHRRPPVQRHAHGQRRRRPTTGTARVKNVQDLKLTGQSLPRYDIPPKVDGSLQVGGGRQAARHGARAQREAAVRGRHAHERGRILGPRRARLRAGRAARQLPGGRLRARGAGHSRGHGSSRPRGSGPTTAPFPTSENLFDYMRSATPTVERAAVRRRHARRRAAERGEDRRGAVRGALPGTRVARSRARDRRSVERSDDDLLERHEVVRTAGRRGASSFRCRAIGSASSGWTGRRATGARPRTMRGSRRRFWRRKSDGPCGCSGCAHEETGWDTKAPAFVVSMRGGLDAQGNLVGYDYEARAADHNHLGYNEHDTVLVAQLANMRRATPNRGSASTPSDMYVIPNRRMAMHVVGLPLVWETPVRTGNLRDPERPAGHVRVRVVHRRAGGRGGRRSDCVPDEAAHGEHHRRQRLQARAVDRGAQGRGRGVRLGRPRVTEADWQRRHSHRPRRRLRVPEPDGRRSKSPKSR